ncbi:MAG: hypothetical protein ACKO7P_07605 [Bacteroidota bacterium]
MKGLILIFFVFKLIIGHSQAKFLSIEGYYQGTNVIVSNPPLSDGYGYCVYKVTVNGDILPATIQMANFEIDFALFRLKKGDKVFIVLEHAENCTPRFMNPQVLLPRSTFECTSITCDNQGLLKWSTKNEDGVLDFKIEQFRWDRWVEIGIVKGAGTKETHNYTFQITPHSGKNIVRVSQTDNSEETRSSKQISFTSNLPKVKKTPSRVTESIFFKANGINVKTKFEIYDAYGNLLKTGFSDSIDCKNLVNGIYFINYDNTSEKFIRAE